MGDAPGDAEGPLGAQPSDAVGEHVAMARIQGALFGASQPATLERYRLLEKVGEGASGVVYSAWDPRLDRKIAIKVLRAGATAELEREAQTLAKLAHPNVVGIHDVGESDDRLFLAMEFVDGAPLSSIDVQALGWRRVVAMYRQAAAGLAAAHDAGIVHRDFKPANALLGADDRVRVVDFGLARAGMVEADGSGGDVKTRAAGTPRYMAPEQHRGEAVDARTDQYCFCAALWEALVGRPAFEADTVDGLAEAKEEVPPLPVSRGAPARVYRVLRRGLAPAASERFPTMRALDAALVRSTRGWTRSVVGLTVVGVALAGGVALGRAEPPCLGADAPPDRWTDSTRQRIRDAFAQTELTHADTVEASAEAMLERWAERWGDARADACGLHAQGVQSAEGLDLRTQCLDDQRARFDALLDVFESADANLVENAIEGAASLPDPAACADLERLRAEHPIPASEREAVEKARDDLARAHAELVAGHFARAREYAAPLVRSCKEGGLAYPPACVEAAVVVGKSAADSGEHGDAVELLTEAAVEAQRMRVFDGFAMAAAGLSWELGEYDGRFDEALTWMELGRASIEGRDALPAEFALLNAEAAVLSNASRFDEAIATHHRRLARLETIHGPESPLAMVSYVNIAGIHDRLGRIKDAEAMYAKGLAIGVPAFGASHPKVLVTRANRGGMRVKDGRFAAGVEELQEVLELQRAAQPSHPDLSATLVNIAIGRQALGDAQGALEAATEAASLIEQAYGADSVSLVDAWMAQVTPLLALGRMEEAVKVSRRAAEVAVAGLGADHVTTAFAVRNLGGALRISGEDAAGKAKLMEAKGLFQALGMTDQVERTQALHDAVDD